MSMPSMSSVAARRSAPFVRLVALAAGYAALGRLGIAQGALPGNVAPLWAPTGLALAAMTVLGPRRAWPGVAVGALLCNGLSGTPWPTSAVIAAGSTAEALLGAHLLRRFDFHGALDRLRDVALLTLAVLACTTISATVGVASLIQAGVIRSGDGGYAWRVWWLGDAAGALVVTSAVLAWCSPAPIRPSRSRPDGAALLLLTGLLTTLGVAAGSVHPYLVFPVVAAIALRFGPKGAATATLGAGIVAVYLTTHGWIVALAADPVTNLREVDAFVSVLAVSALLLAAMVSERNAAQTELQGANRDLEARIEARTLDLHRDREELAEAQRLARVGSWHWDVDTDEVTWSEEIYRICGLVPAVGPVSAELNWGLIHPEHVEQRARAINAALTSGTPFEHEYRIVRPSGDVRWVFGRGAPDVDDDGRVVSLHGICQDITERKRADQQFGDLLESAPDAMILVDRDGVIVRANQQAERLFGHQREKLIGAPVEILLPSRFRTAHRRERGGYTAAPVSRPMGEGQELLAMRADGSEFPVDISLSPIQTAGGEVLYAAAVRDITQRRRVEEALAHQANHDALTRLPNRTLLLDRLEQAVARGRRSRGHVAVLFLDLDRFKLLNDSGGHAVGDQVLVTVAERLTAEVRPGDTVARFGGDEFVVVCEGMESVDDVVLLSDRISLALAKPFPVGPDEVFLTVSVGVALAQDPMPAEELLRNADAAMYRAKEQGRASCAIYDDTMRAQAAARLEIHSALHRAVERHELRVLYQPIVDLKTSDLVGVEALVRWEHPERGLVGPEAFVPLAEEGGLIVPIGRWVLEEACRQWAAWRAEWPDRKPLTLSVNLSPRQFREASLVDVVRSTMATFGLSEDDLCLELTESVFLEDAELHRETFQGLGRLGVRLAIDDFGTGFSSLTYLKRFPVDIIKVDRGFVAGLGGDAYDSAIVESVVELGHALGLRVVAEGIETDDQRHRLQGLGCDFAQGFLFARPLPAEEISASLRTGPGSPSRYGPMERGGDHPISWARAMARPSVVSRASRVSPAG
jgi:diguanylate cyclase (GGDEF)-like protein/PAS domain S-box-containing protein